MAKYQLAQSITIFVYRVFSENDVIYYFIVLVKSMSIFYRCYLYELASAFADVLITNPPYVLSGESHHGQVSIGPDYKIFAYWLLRKLKMLLQIK